MCLLNLFSVNVFGGNKKMLHQWLSVQQKRFLIDFQGTFQLMPGEAMTKFSHKCSNAIEATSSISKEQVQVSLLKDYLDHN